jgi:hypothetical protein
MGRLFALLRISLGILGNDFSWLLRKARPQAVLSVAP